MKVLCILQNAWGPFELPMVFKPSPWNKSAKRLQSICVGHTIYFGNTTLQVTAKANGHAKPDPEHVKKLLARAVHYDLILVCGKQAEEAVIANLPKGFDRHIIWMPHPASRTLTNALCEQVKQKVCSAAEVKDYCLRSRFSQVPGQPVKHALIQTL